MEWPAFALLSLIFVHGLAVRGEAQDQPPIRRGSAPIVVRKGTRQVIGCNIVFFDS